MIKYIHRKKQLVWNIEAAYYLISESYLTSRTLDSTKADTINPYTISTLPTIFIIG
jgi:hypothetical protein